MLQYNRHPTTHYKIYGQNITGSVTVQHLTHDQEIAGSTPCWAGVKWLLLGRATADSR